MTSPTSSILALQAVQNASADPRTQAALREANVMEVLAEAAATLPPQAAAMACGAIANLEQLRQQSEEAEQFETPQHATPRPADIPVEHPFSPTPPRCTEASLQGGGGAASTVLTSLGVTGVSHRALPQLCCQLSDFCPLVTRRKAVIGLAEVLRSRSLDAGSALELLRRCGAIDRLIDILFDDGTGETTAGGAVAGPAQGLGGGSTSSRVAPPPTQPDAVLRDGCLHLLVLIAHLGGLELLCPVQRVTAALGGALVSTEPSARAQAADFWRAVAIWEVFAESLARAIFPLGAVRSAGVRVEGTGAFTNGVAVLLALTRREHEGGWGTSLACAQSAAAALVSSLAHPNLQNLWKAPTLGYLIKLDDQQIAGIRELPAKLANRELQL